MKHTSQIWLDFHTTPLGTMVYVGSRYLFSCFKFRIKTGNHFKWVVHFNFTPKRLLTVMHIESVSHALFFIL